MGRDGLGEFEQVVLLTVWRLGADAYGAAIRRELQERSGRRRSISAIYVTLMRLEKKGLVQSTLADPTPVRGGKAKRLFDVAPAGLEALKSARTMMNRMWEGLESADPHVR